MRLILSRKGFDSGWGGFPSPVLPDGRLYSFPIPDLDGLPYGSLHVNERLSCADLMAQLGIETISYPQRGRIPVSQAGAHLDPDLDPGSLARHPGWRPAFGQVAGAQTHLQGRGVGPGDVFVFYGWFRATRENGGGLRYDSKQPGVHAVWGYLEVDEVVAVAEVLTPPVGLQEHPTSLSDISLGSAGRTPSTWRPSASPSTAVSLAVER